MLTLGGNALSENLGAVFQLIGEVVPEKISDNRPYISSLDMQACCFG